MTWSKTLKTMKPENPILNDMYQFLLRPFLQPFYELFEHFVSKLWLAGVFLLAWLQTSNGIQEVELVGIVFAVIPLELLIGLNILIGVDWITGTSRALFDSSQNFRFRKWVQTAYKLTAYNGAALTVSVVMSMFPEIYTYAQYILYVVLSGNELWSILRNLRLTSVAYTVLRMMKGRTLERRSWSSVFKEEMKKQDKED